ncbi:hypothetical protein Taro_027693, partial [Colocasia esculenta]|nr:hypothetical protein [Colocasia esculenta]
MVRGGRSGSSSRRGIRGRALFSASVSGSPSSERTPPLPSGLVAGPSSASPSVPAVAGPSSASPSVPAVSSSSAPTVPVVTAVGASSESPPVVAGSVPEDAGSLQEGRGSFYESTLREVWIN